MKINTKLTGIACGVLGAVCSLPATSAPAPGGLEEIIVTATKRAESINDVGLTIAAFGADMLRTQRINGVEDLTRIVPSLHVAPSEANTPVYTLRGVGFYENTIGSYPAVSVYMDEVGYPLPVFTTNIGFDLERVEVMKGPQGTLFGQNSTGGAINFIAAKPTDIFEAGFDVGYGRFDYFEGFGFVSGPLTDTLKARAAIKTEQANGWQKSITRNDSLGEIDTFAGRILLDWQPTDKASFLLNIGGSKNQNDPLATQIIDKVAQVPPLQPQLIAAPVPPLKPRYADWTATDSLSAPYGDDEQAQASLRATIELSDTLTLTSISSYVDFERNQFNDPDGAAIEQYAYSTVAQADSIAQELRIDGVHERVKWVVGGNYERSTFSEQNTLVYSDASTVVSGGQTFLQNGYDTSQKMENIAFFGNIEYDLTEQLSVNAGARYTESQRRSNSCTRETESVPNLSGFFTFLSNMLREPQGLSPIDPIPLGGCVNLDNVTVDDMGRTPYTPGVFTDKLKEDNVSWRVGVDYKLNPDVLLYATIAKGYKAGGHPAATAATNIQFLPVTEESVLDYEAGFKAQLLDNKLSITGAAFFYDYKDKQLRVKLLDPVFGLLDGIRNVPESEVMGAEFTLTATPVEGWTIGMAGTYLDTEITEYSGYNAIAEIVDFAGVAMPFAPETSLSMHTDYSFSLSQNIMGFVGANATHNSHTFSTVGEDEYARIDDYTLVDLRAGIMSPDDRWRVTLWGKNVFDEYYWTNARIVNDVRARYPGRTATYGITFGYRM